MTKVLVFENDSGFAEELRSGLGRLGCETTVVDDANVGLQTAAQDKPDLILLAIELQRMNGFSVCNKLKRDPSLKNVPLIIMSTESTDETFEQHKRLRTRADDYVHKPIGFGTLLTHIQAFVKLGAPGEATGADSESSVIETDVGLGTPALDLSDSEIMSAPVPSVRSVAPQKPQHYPSEVPLSEDDIPLHSVPPDADGLEVAEAEVVSAPPEVEPIGDSSQEDVTVARFSVSSALLAEAARAAGGENREAAPSPESDTRSFATALGLPEPPVESSPSPSLGRTPRPSVSPRPTTLAPLSADSPRLRQELERQRERINELEDEARTAEARIAELEEAQRRDGSRDQQVQKLQRELDDAKAKLASGRTGGSARDLLDLREQLNRKDKEMLDLRDQLTHRDKELLALRDGALALERDKADLIERQAELEKQLADLSRTADAHRNDKEAASKRADDFKRKAERLKADLDARNADLVELRTQAELRIQEAVQATELAERERGEQALAALREQLAAELRSALAEAERQAEQRGLEALARRESELAEAEAGRVAELERAHSEALARRDKENAERIVETQRAHAAELAETTRVAAERLSDSEAAAAERLNEEQRIFMARLAEREAELEQTIAMRTDERDRARGEGEARALELERTRAELAKRDEQLAAANADAEVKAGEHAELSRKLAEVETKLRAVEAALISTSTDLEQARSGLNAERERLERARSKWQGDRVSLERTKDALAAALSQIDEIEARQLD